MTPGFQTVLHIAKDMQMSHRWRVTQHLAYHSATETILEAIRR